MTISITVVYLFEKINDSSFESNINNPQLNFNDSLLKSHNEKYTISNMIRSSEYVSFIPLNNNTMNGLWVYNDNPHDDRESNYDIISYGILNPNLDDDFFKINGIDYKIASYIVHAIENGKDYSVIGINDRSNREEKNEIIIQEKKIEELTNDLNELKNNLRMKYIMN